LVVLLSGLFMNNVDTAVTNVAAPAIGATFQASGAQLQLVVAAYVLAYAMLLITGARLGGIHGYRRVFLAGLAWFTLASLASGLAPGAVPLVLARFAQGAGAALMVPQVLIGIQVGFPARTRARALGFYTVALSAGAVAGQVLGGVLVSADVLGAGWRPIFLVNVPIGVVLMAAGVRLLPPDGGNRAQRLDLRGTAALSAAVLLGVAPLVLGRDEGWPAWTWPCLAASLAALWLFVAVERRVAAGAGRPLVDLQILRRPAVHWGLIAYAAETSTYFAMLFVLALYLQRGLGKSPLYSGLVLVSWVAAFGCAGPVLRHLPGRLPELAAPAGALALATAYFGVSLSLAGGSLSGPQLVALLGLGGLGLGTSLSSMIKHLTSAVPAASAPDISGLITTGAQIGGVAGVATFGTAYLGLAPHGSPGAATLALTMVAAAFGVTALLGAATARLSIGRRTASLGTVPRREEGTA
jgi:MFS family permease